jgi:Flp pilus assembly protein TadD
LDNAFSDFTEAIRLDPKDAEVYRSRAIAYRKIGNTAKAAHDDQKVTE